MRLTGLLLLAWLGAAAPAAAQGPLADGDRWVAWDDPSRPRTTVRDDVRGRTRSVERPPGCSSVLIGGGNLLWACRGDDVVLDLRSGARRAVPAPPEPPPYGGSYGYARIGRRWLERSFFDYHVEGTLHYVDLQTGERRDGPSGRPSPDDVAASPREVVDLDEPDLASPLCRPLSRRRQDDFEVTPSFLPYFFDGRMGAEVGYQRIAIQRCGERRRRVLRPDCQGDCDLSFGARRVVFVRRFADAGRAGSLGVYDDRTGRVRCLRTRLTSGFGHTRRRLWLTGGDGRPRRAPFPRRRC